MDTSFEEINYPLKFRENDSKTLGNHLKLRHCVELVGMKRVGISNFLRFFLNKKDVVQVYIDKKEYHFFVTVDLNDLIEIEILPFWILTFKRLVDRISFLPVDEAVKKEVTTLFAGAIKSQDIFLTVDALRKSLVLICKNNVYPTLFLLRFDRIGQVVNKQFYANLVGLREATAERLSYVFTSFRTLDRIAPEVFERKLMSEFSHEMYLQPAKKEDFETIFEGLASKYRLEDGKTAEEIIKLCGGHVQYLQLASIILSQRKEKTEAAKIAEVLESDERIRYLGEEIWESLRDGEQEVLTEVIGSKQYDREKAKYLWVTGILDEKNKVFSRLFADSLGKHGAGNSRNGDEKVEFTKKEYLLYNYLLEHVGEVCEREKIIESVWSEIEDLGVSDWTIDRLVARLRMKLKKQGSKYQVVTVKTRGYKLTE
jgi:hypothetical protein